MRVADPSESRPLNEFNQSLAELAAGDAVVGLVPIRGWPHRVTRASKGFAGGDNADSVVKPPCFSSQTGHGGEKRSLWVVKPRRVGPITSPACPLYCQAALRLFEGGRGEAFAVAGLRDATVVWAGGLHSGRNARMSGWGSWRGLQTPRPVPPHGFFLLVLPSRPLPSGGGEHSRLRLSLSLCFCSVPPSHRDEVSFDGRDGCERGVSWGSAACPRFIVPWGVPTTSVGRSRPDLV